MQLYPENNSPELFFTNEDKLIVYSKGTVLAHLLSRQSTWCNFLSTYTVFNGLLCSVTARLDRLPAITDDGGGVRWLVCDCFVHLNLEDALYCPCVCVTIISLSCVLKHRFSTIFCPVILQNVLIWQWAHKYVILFEVALHDLSVLWWDCALFC